MQSTGQPPTGRRYLFQAEGRIRACVARIEPFAYKGIIGMSAAVIFQFVLVLTTFLCSLVAGFLLAFAVVAMPGIKSLNDRDFLKAFQAMDRIIQKQTTPLYPGLGRVHRRIGLRGDPRIHSNTRARKGTSHPGNGPLSFRGPTANYHHQHTLE